MQRAMSASQRRPHKKSRHGCLQCKKNRTKCDEKRPCGRCERRNEECSLMNSSSALPFIADSNSSPVYHDNQHTKSNTIPDEHIDTTVFTPDNTSIQTPASSIITTDLNELHFSSAERHRLRLINHYACHTSEAIAELSLPTPEGLSIWRNDVAALAFEHDFLLHMILAMTSLHLALSTTNPTTRKDNINLATHHHNQGITLFAPHLNAITPQNLDPLFGFSILVTVYSFGIHRIENLTLNPLAKIHEVMTLIRGTSVIARSNVPQLMKGIFKATLIPRPSEIINETNQPLAPEIETALSALTDRITFDVATSAYEDVYTSSILTLRQSLTLATTRPHTQAVIVLFPIMIPPEFLKLVCMNQSLALAILATYAATLHWLRSHIVMQGWGKKTVDAVREALPKDWLDCIEWAVRTVADE